MQNGTLQKASNIAKWNTIRNQKQKAKSKQNWTAKTIGESDLNTILEIRILVAKKAKCLYKKKVSPVSEEYTTVVTMQTARSCKLPKKNARLY